jgi:Domain of unknown function (DUF5666)
MAIKRVSLQIAAAALAATLMLSIFVLPAQAALRHIDGTVVSKDASTKTFRVKTQSGNALRIKVTSSTTFQRIGGFGKLQKGLAVEVEAKTTGGGLVAVKVETRGGGRGGNPGGGGADDHGGGHGGAGDGPNHT